MQRVPGLADGTAQGDVDLTPMLDVVFIMLIFFIVTASFLKEYGLDVARSDAVNRPVTSTGILVTIDENSGIWIDGRNIDPRAVRANIERLHAENPSGGVIVDAHSRSSNRTLVQIMDASRQAGIYDIMLAER